MAKSELVQSTMTSEVSNTYHALRRVTLHPPEDPNEFVEKVLEAIRRHPEQLAELAGRWHRRVVKMRLRQRGWAEQMEWFQEKGGRTDVMIWMSTSNQVMQLGDEHVRIFTHNPATVATIVQEHGGTHYPEHSCWLLDQGVDVDRWVSHIEDMLAAMSQPAEPTYTVKSGYCAWEDDEHGSVLNLSEALATASHVFAAHQQRRVEAGLPSLDKPFTALDDSDSAVRDDSREVGWYWVCDDDESVNGHVVPESVIIWRDDPSNAVA